MGLRISLLGVNEMWEFGSISDEEYGSVVEYPVPIAFLSLKLDGKSTRVTSGIC